MANLLGKRVWQIQDQKDKSEKKSSWRREIRTDQRKYVRLRSERAGITSIFMEI